MIDTATGGNILMQISTPALGPQIGVRSHCCHQFMLWSVDSDPW